MTETGRPLVTVVIAARNAAATLPRAIESIVVQTLDAREVVVIDGGSRDGTIQLLESAEPVVTYWESAPDRGISHAWNKALGHARGDWLLFLGADDRLASPNVLERAAVALRATAAAVAYGQVEIVRPDGAVLAIEGEPWASASEPFRRDHNTLPHQGVFHRRELFERRGEFDESFRICADYELLLRELQDADPLYIPDLVVAAMADGGISRRGSSQYRATREMYRARRRNGLAKVPEWLSYRIARATAFEAIRRSAGPNAARRSADAYHALARRLALPRRKQA